MIGHLGSRVSSLLDGQLPAAEEDRAWEHVHLCPQCRDLVEREGWVKTQLAGLSFGSTDAPADLKGSLLGTEPEPGLAPIGGDQLLALSHRPRHRSGLVALGGGAVGVAVVGVLALGAAPADVPNLDRRAPVSNLTRPTETARTQPVAVTGAKALRRHAGTQLTRVTSVGAKMTK